MEGIELLSQSPSRSQLSCRGGWSTGRAGQGRASLAAGFVTQAQSCWEESGVARPAAPADGEDLPSQQKLQGSLRRRGGSTPALPATRGSVQAKG